MEICKFCKTEVKANQRFILTGLFPSGREKFSNYFWHGALSELEDFGDLYHEECFFTTIKR
jgi:hypothetical protein